MRLPVIVERNAWTLAHERYNADWIEEQQLGIVVSNFSKVAEAVGEMLKPRVYKFYRDKTAAIRKFAVYEIPPLLEKILSGGSQAQKHSPMEMFSPKSYDSVTVLGASS